MPYKALLTGALLLAGAASAPAALVFFDDFNSGDSTSFLNGTTPDTNTLGNNASATWVSTTTGNTTFRADGSITNVAGSINDDRGAWLNLGAGFIQANTTYTITLDFSNVSNSIIYFGFQDSTSPNTVGIRAQNQGALTVGGAIRNLGARQEYSLMSGDGAETLTTLPFSASGTLTAVIQSNNLTNATVTVGNLTSTVFDATTLQHLVLAIEDDTPVSGATLNSITIDAVAVPEPSIALLGGLALLGLLRRRRA